jgi:hypothetical protein
VDPRGVDERDLEAGRRATPRMRRRVVWVIHDRDLLADEGVDQGRFARVRAADDGDLPTFTRPAQFSAFSSREPEISWM